MAARRYWRPWCTASASPGPAIGRPTGSRWAKRKCEAGWTAVTKRRAPLAGWCSSIPSAATSSNGSGRPSCQASVKPGPTGLDRPPEAVNNYEFLGRWCARGGWGGWAFLTITRDRIIMMNYAQSDLHLSAQTSTGHQAIAFGSPGQSAGINVQTPSERHPSSNLACPGSRRRVVRWRSGCDRWDETPSCLESTPEAHRPGHPRSAA